MNNDPVPLIKADLPDFEEVEKDFRNALSTGQVTNFGRVVRDFEEALTGYLGVPARTTSSGTTALLLALESIGGVAGKLVAIPSFTFVATAQAVLLAGGTPVFIDIRDDFTMSPDDLGTALEAHGEEIAAVVPVHTYGMPCAVKEIERLADHNPEMPVIYDSAHAFGSAIGDERVGTFGTAEVFSLSVTKALVSIEGGLVASADEKFIERIEKMRNYGIGANYESYFKGTNGKMSEFHAAVGLANLRLLDERLKLRRERAKRYTRLLKEQALSRPIPVPAEVTHTYKDFTVVLPEHLSHQRDDIMARMAEDGIETRSYFWPPVHLHRMFSGVVKRPVPRTEDLGRRVITLPFFTTLSDEEMDRVVGALAAAERSAT